MVQPRHRIMYSIRMAACGYAESLSPLSAFGSSAHRRTNGSQMVAKPEIVGAAELPLVLPPLSPCLTLSDGDDRERTRRPAMARPCSSHRGPSRTGACARQCRPPRVRAGHRPRTNCPPDWLPAWLNGRGLEHAAAERRAPESKSLVGKTGARRAHQQVVIIWWPEPNTCTDVGRARPHVALGATISWMCWTEFGWAGWARPYWGCFRQNFGLCSYIIGLGLTNIGLCQTM